MIREATNRDIKELIFIDSHCFNEGDQFSYSQFWHGIHRSLKPLYVFCCHDTNIPVGYIYYIVAGNDLRIYSLAVLPNYQKKGIGTALLNHPFRYHAKGIRLECRYDNQSLISFYEKHGYKAISVKHNYYSDGMDAVYMRRALDVTR
jgi:[ribosomal protein S18]-alanine N-acetyltransferase